MSVDGERDPVTKLFGALLMAVGGLIAGACGLCSLAFLVSMGADGGGVMPVVLIFGGIPIAVGVLIFRAGLKLWRPAVPPPAP